MEAGLAELLASAASSAEEEAGAESADRTTQRILDAALGVAASVGVERLTVEDVVRRAGVARMTAYRRYPRRDDLVGALVQRETQRFLAAVAAGIDGAGERDGVTEAFVAAVRFAREHPLLRRVSQADPGGLFHGIAAENGRLLAIGVAFIARQIHGERPGSPSREARWVADVFARLFLAYVSVPPTDPDFADEAQLRRFADEVLSPMVARVPSGESG
jgi:AcrR family transcriptional regulator